MKKTLIALAVAASAVVSGSAMAAWTANGTGGNFEVGGTLTPVEKMTPWEVKVGGATVLNSNIQKGQSAIDIPVEKAIPILGIRVADSSKKAFNGGGGITPNIDFRGAVDLAAFSKGTTSLRLNVKNSSDQEIGTLTTQFSAGAEYARYNEKTKKGEKYNLYQKSSGELFFGGLGKNADSIPSNAWSLAKALDPEFVANYNDFGVTTVSPSFYGDVLNPTFKYNAFYGAGIEKGKTIKVTLSAPVNGADAIAWKASWPITVTYQ